MEDNDLLNDFVIEAKEHLADVENQFLAIEEGGADVDVDLVNEVFRAIHSIKGAAGFLGLSKVNDLSHNLENVLNMIRNRELTPTSEIVDTMLRAADTLVGMIDEVNESESADIDHHVTELTAIAEGEAPAAPAETPAAETTAEEPATEEPAVAETAVEEPAAAETTDNDAAPAAEEAEPASELSIDEQIEAAFAAKRAEAQARKATKAETSAAKPAAAKDNTAKPAAEKPAPEANIRVSVGVLDSLMNLAGELVLSRNQLLQAISREEQGGLEAISARLDQVTSELQEAIMQTRMQQIGTVFGRFPRVVRDLSSKLGKKCNLEIEGKETEVDKTIVEAIGDPLTHLVRNSVDHGVESPADRKARNKPEVGTISLRAYYQAGKVRIEIEDDGGGIDPNKLKEKALAKGLITQERADQMSDREAVRLIFAPGFSTAKEVTDVSGRGVGMDVVRTNIAKLGGTVDVESVLGEGTNMVVTLPLTLAIIPSLIVQVGKDRFAIPQVNIAELVRIRQSERETKLGRVKDAEVLRLRGSLLPLVRLSEALGCESPEGEDTGNGATNVIVVDTGHTRFGLVVDALHDSEEIVVKPLGRHHKDCRCLAGATILGDGHVALILDVAGVAADAELSAVEEASDDDDKRTDDPTENEDMQSVLLFNNSPDDQFAIPMDIVARIERIRSDQIDSVGGQEVLQYKSTTLPLLRLENHVSTQPCESLERVYVVVFEAAGREIGLIAPQLQDIRDVPTSVDTVTFREPGVIGSLVIEEQATRLIDLFGVAELAHPDWFESDEMDASTTDEGLPPLVLLAEDSGFFRAQVQDIVESKGYRVEPCEDGQIAWDKLESGEYDISLVLTDIEMPNMNGFDLCHKIKQTPHLSELPVIALTSLAGSADIERGIEVGVDDYQIKMDREKLVASLKNFCDPTAGSSNKKTELARS